MPQIIDVKLTRIILIDGINPNPTILSRSQG
jgi:hypothetical protein